MDRILEAVKRYYASEAEDGPLSITVAKTWEDLRKVARFLGVPDAESFTYEVNWAIQSEMERRNL